jgi:hypothetical protein
VFLKAARDYFHRAQILPQIIGTKYSQLSFLCLIVLQVFYFPPSENPGYKIHWLPKNVCPLLPLWSPEGEAIPRNYCEVVFAPPPRPIGCRKALERQSS